jgi:Fe-S-cluster-containing hydrogenase component 2
MDDKNLPLKNGVVEMARIETDGLPSLVSAILDVGYRLLGPALSDGAIVYKDLESAEALPAGQEDEQAPGIYRIQKGNSEALFSYIVGPHSWKRFLHPPRIRLACYDRELNPIPETDSEDKVQPLAFFGVRPCEIAAIRIQDQVFLEGPYIDREYESNRKNLLIVAVDCSRPAQTCFCASMGTGPSAHEGFDLALTEIHLEDEPYFLVRVGTEIGERLLEAVPHRPANAEEISQRNAVLARAERRLQRSLDTTGLPELLRRNFDHPRWEQTGKRCLSCGNCTMVCPTCFCATVEEVTDLTGDRAERWRTWDSCFTADFSYIHGGIVRHSTKSRYRQWMTHKLSTWVDQFGTSGCVGCGRCLTWCPVGIDITEEAAFIRSHDMQSKSDSRKRRDGNENH